MKVLITDRSGKAGRARRGLKGKVKGMAESILKELRSPEREISILLTTDAEIEELNARYRGKDSPTDVLSFPMDDDELMGDVVISIERAKEQASRFGFSDDEEIARLLAHGTLHLLGYEHENGGRQAAKMKRKEAELMVVLQAKSLI